MVLQPKILKKLFVLLWYTFSCPEAENALLKMMWSQTGSQDLLTLIRLKFLITAKQCYFRCSRPAVVHRIQNIEKDDQAVKHYEQYYAAVTSLSKFVIPWKVGDYHLYITNKSECFHYRGGYGIWTSIKVYTVLPVKLESSEIWIHWSYVTPWMYSILDRPNLMSQ